MRQALTAIVFLILSPIKAHAEPQLFSGLTCLYVWEWFEPTVFPTIEKGDLKTEIELVFRSNGIKLVTEQAGKTTPGCTAAVIALNGLSIESSVTGASTGVAFSTVLYVIDDAFLARQVKAEIGMHRVYSWSQNRLGVANNSTVRKLVGESVQALAKQLANDILAAR